MLALTDKQFQLMMRRRFRNPVGDIYTVDIAPSIVVKLTPVKRITLKDSPYNPKYKVEFEQRIVNEK